MAKEKRSEYIKCQFRASINEDKKMVLRGYPILFNTETIIYDYWAGEVRETILPTALDETNLEDVYLLVGHNADNVLGKVGANMRVEKDETGLFFECTLPDTQLARDWYTLINEGIVDGMSFGFTTNDRIDYDKHTRTITKIDELFEITITPFPAYKEASVVAQRKQELIDEEERAAELKKKEEAEAQEKAKAEEQRQAKIKELEEL